MRTGGPSDAPRAWGRGKQAREIWLPVGVLTLGFLPLPRLPGGLRLSNLSYSTVRAAGSARGALSAFNLVIFSGVFTVQWGIGLLVDGMRALGWAEVSAFRGAMAVFLACSVAAYGWFMRANDNRQQG